jgi:hypothetical protein
MKPVIRIQSFGVLSDICGDAAWRNQMASWRFCRKRIAGNAALRQCDE